MSSTGSSCQQLLSCCCCCCSCLSVELCSILLLSSAKDVFSRMCTLGS
jgi:hypothetical protein